MNIVSAKFVNEDQSAVAIMTDELGSVIVSLKDRPDLWDEYIKWNGKTDPFIVVTEDQIEDKEMEDIFNGGSFQSALVRVMLSEINVLRNALSLPSRTPLQLLTAIKARRKS